jgi:hypothetical protein
MLVTGEVTRYCLYCKIEYCIYIYLLYLNRNPSRPHFAAIWRGHVIQPVINFFLLIFLAEHIDVTRPLALQFRLHFSLFHYLMVYSTILSTIIDTKLKQLRKRNRWKHPPCPFKYLGPVMNRPFPTSCTQHISPWFRCGNHKPEE